MENPKGMWCVLNGMTEAENIFHVDKDSNVLVARVQINVDKKTLFIPCQVLFDADEILVAYKDKVHKSEDFEVLMKQENYTWTSDNKSIPKNALLVDDYNKLFIGRVSHEGQFYIGAVDSLNKFCMIVCDGKAKKFLKFDLLIAENSKGKGEALKSCCVATPHHFKEEFKETNVVDDKEDTEERRLANIKTSRDPNIRSEFRNVINPKVRQINPQGSSAEESFWKLQKPKEPEFLLKEEPCSEIRVNIYDKEPESVTDGITRSNEIELQEEIEVHEEIIEVPPTPTSPSILTKNELKVYFAPVELILEELKLSDFTSLVIEQVPSTKDMLNIIKNEEVVEFINNSKCVEITINITSKMDFLKTSEWTRLSELFNNKGKSMMISFSDNEKFQVGWKAAKNEKMMNIPIGGNHGDKNEEFEKFMMNYLRKCMRSNHTGITPDANPDTDLSCLIIDPNYLYDKRGYSLLMIAAEQGDLNAVDYLLKLHADESYEVDKKIPIDLVNKSHPNYSKIILSLLNENSRFPKNFNEDDENLSEDLKAFASDMKEIHKLVKTGDLTNVAKMLDDYPNLRHFYNPSKKSLNNSVYRTAEKSNQNDILELFSKKSILKAHYEMGRLVRAATESITTFKNTMKRKKALKRSLTAPEPSKDESNERNELIPMKSRQESDMPENGEVNNTTNDSSDGGDDERRGFLNRLRSSFSFFVSRHRKERDRPTAAFRNCA